jgi:hypothetical protein
MVASGQGVDLAQNALAAIASGSDVSYGVRTQSALALAGIRHPVELGSAELNLLAGGTGAIAAPGADQPFFCDARLRATQTSADAGVKVQLLSNSLADTPARDDARIPLFQAAARMHSDEFARGVIEPLLRHQFFSSVSPLIGRDAEIAAETNNDADDENGASQAEGPFKLAIIQQAQIVRSLGELMIRLDRLDESLRYLRIARKLERVPARRKEISSTIAEVSARLRRQRLNAARQPILHEALEQDRLVRPRLLARSVPPAQETVKGGTRK